MASGLLAHEINSARDSVAAARPPAAFRVCVICRSRRTMPILSCSEPAPFSGLWAPTLPDGLLLRRQRFFELDRTNVDDHHGLGLSIVRAVAIAHDATLTANARRQGGLPIEIHVPLIPCAMPR